MKKITKKTKKKIIEFITYGTGILGLIVGFIAWIFEMKGFFDIPENEIYDEIICIITLALIYTSVFLLFKFGDGNMSPVNRFKYYVKYKLNYKIFSEFNDDIRKKLELKNYSIGKEYIISPKNEKIYIYYKLENKKINIWIVADLISFTKEKWKKFEKCLEDFYTTTFGEQNYQLENGFVVLCVQRYSSTFEEFINETRENFGNSLPVGINMSEKMIFTSRSNDLSEEFFKMVDATPIQNKKRKRKKQKNKITKD